MKKTLCYILLSLGISLSAYSFEYRIVSKTPDSKLNGLELILSNEADWGGEDCGVIDNGVIDIKGESKRSFPAHLIVKNSDQNSGNKQYYSISLIVEPGTIVVDVNEDFPLQGGILNDGWKNCHIRLSEVEYRTVPSKEIIEEVFKKNVGNGLGERALLYYGLDCSPDEWMEMVALLDDESKNLAAIENMTERKERLRPVWEGQPFAELIGQTLEGNPTSLSQYVGKGRYVVADLWASWCGGCISQANQYLKPLYEEYKDNPDIMFLGIAMDDVNQAVDKFGYEWPQMNECRRLMATYGVYSVPEIIIFAPDGTILKRFLRGADLKDLLKDLLPEKPKTGDFIGGQSLK
ncbi:MAG: TlpA family protein disulfide reductase [Muribaculaceae bacterium]|nr:TlpA family protein disulfide reductase [Muribaculaceae bacterium]